MARQPGQVRDAIIRVLKTAGKPMRVSEIHAAVEADLGGPVAESSVRSYLQIGSSAHFEKMSKGIYRSRTR